MNGSIQSMAPPTDRPARPISGLLSTAIVVVVGALLVHVLLETWAQVLSGPTSVDPRANLDGSAQWPKQLKTVLYLGLAGLTVVKVAVDRLWHRFLTGADLALVVLGLVMVLAGLVNDSSMSLMGEALFVYFRGVIVFYALRAADLNSMMIRRLLIVVAVVVSVNVLLALVQMVVGEPAYRVLGWVDLTWSEQSRAQGLLSHPNHLGHVLGLTRRAARRPRQLRRRRPRPSPPRRPPPGQTAARPRQVAPRPRRSRRRRPGPADPAVRADRRARPRRSPPTRPRRSARSGCSTSSRQGKSCRVNPFSASVSASSAVWSPRRTIRTGTRTRNSARVASTATASRRFRWTPSGCT
ncbi:hypothetical protein KBX53_14345, partial [Micromonospora sp. M51]|nr:hypothetical protein [Micromonospora sp. M51]